MKNIIFSDTSNNTNENKKIISSINVEDIVKYSNICNYDGMIITDNGKYQLNDDQFEYIKFLNYIDTYLIGSTIPIEDKIKSKTKIEKIAYLQGRIDQIVEELYNNYIMPGLKNKFIEFDKSNLFFKNLTSGYVLNYLLKLNGYRISTDLNLNNLAQSNLPNHPQKSLTNVITIQKTYEPLKEEKIKNSIKRFNIKNISNIVHLIVTKEDYSK